MREYDIVIIGAGPAGSNLARLLDKKFKVLIIEKKSMIDSNAKCCGGLLAPDAQKSLASQNLSIPKEILVSPQVFAVKVIDFDNNLEKYYQRFYYNMNRGKFDNWLFSLIPDNVDKKTNSSFKNFEKIDNEYLVEYIENKEKIKVKTKYIVAADGANSKLRKILDIKNNPKKYISIQEYYNITTKENINNFVAVFDSEITDYYSWIIPKENILILGTAVENTGSARKKFEKLKKKLENKAYKFSEKIKVEMTYINRPLKINELFFEKDNIYFIGESGGLISPSSAEGISYALNSSKNLAKQFNDSENMNKYILKVKINLFLKKLKSKFMYNKIIRKLIIKSGIFSMSIKG
ncbi:FAD-binding protein [Oceanivirga salmonicida]|uniref:FAD-binding protein n=1 Tax=Oceanivirga salmonicida TaxID=1769291 RepID=UPI000836F646|nr:FAD-binding protein [Oceanivirga salmonicida]